AWKQDVVRRLSEGVRRLLKGHGIEYVQGTGWFINDQEIRVEGLHGSLRFKFETCILATGATATPAPGLPFDATHILTPEQALALPELPASLSIYGDTFIALELATLFARLDVQVRLYVPGPQPVPGLDAAALRLLQASLRKQGIAVSLNSEP